MYTKNRINDIIIIFAKQKLNVSQSFIPFHQCSFASQKLKERRNSKNVKWKIECFYRWKKICWRLPKVGIRPTIDGRYGGVRESLEEQTKRLAKAVAEFIENNVYLPNGEKVKCVLPQMCIGAVVEARMADELFKKEGVGVSITVTPCWCYGTETMDMTLDIPKAVWGFNGTERPGAVYLAAVSAAHNQKGIPVFKIYGKDVQDRDDFSIPQDVQEKILKVCKKCFGSFYNEK